MHQKQEKRKRKKKDTCLYMSLFNFILPSNLLVSVMFPVRWFSFFGDFYWLLTLSVVCMPVNQIV